MKNDKKFISERKAALKALGGIERKFGRDVARSAMRKHLQVVQGEESRLKKIAQLQKEIEQIHRKRN
jgi:hypothetical protein